MATITSTGLGSGVEVNSIVPQLVAVERKAADARLDRQEAQLQTKISSWGTVKSAFSEFQSTLSALRLPSTFQGISASSSDESALSVTASSTADVGNYAIEVQQLAQKHSLASMRFNDPTDVVGQGTLTLRFGTTDYDADTDTYNGFTQNPNRPSATIVIDSSNNTLSGLRDAINQANAGVQASLINDGVGYRLVLNTAEGGAANSMQISVADLDGDHTDTLGLSALAFNGSATNMQQTLAAQDARLKINGLEVSSATNTLTQSLKGVTLNLHAAQVGKVVQVDVRQDSSALTSALENLVTKFNELNETVNSVAGYDASTRTGGILQGDALVRGAMNQVRRQLSAPVEGLSGAVRSLMDVGIRTQADGSLKLDSAKLASALKADPAGVAGLFSAQGTASDSGIQYRSSTAETQVGSYAIDITEMATKGRFEGGNLDALVVNSLNNSFRVNVDGIISGLITLTEDTYADAPALIAELQARINGDSALRAAGVGVDVSFNAADNRVEMTSRQYGSVSGVALLDVAGAGLGLDNGTYTAGLDVAGTIGGGAATGNGQTLTAVDGDAKGLAVAVESGTTGARGSLSFSRGLLQGLDQALNGLLSSTGMVNARTDGLQRSLTRVNQDRAALDLRMEKYEAMLYKQFNAMDLLVGQFKSTSSYLTQQLLNMPFANQGKQ